MTEDARKARNAERLSECYAGLLPKFGSVIADLERKGLRPRIQEAARSPKDQLIAFNTGHSKLKFGFHTITLKNGTPAACALDILDDDSPLKPSDRFTLMLVSSALAHGLNVGAFFGLSTHQKQIIKDTIARKDWDAPVRFGWDSGHVEPKTLLSAKLYESTVVRLFKK